MTLRLQDVLFALLAVALIVLAAYHFAVAVLALLGAFLCGGLYVIVGMLPTGDQSFGERAFVSGFLAVVLSSLVLIVPGTLGARGADVQTAVLTIAALLPLLAVAFEALRTPRVIRGILRCLGYR